MTLYSKLLFAIKRAHTIRKLERVDARMLADMGIPADDIAFYVMEKLPDPDRRQVTEPMCAATGMPPLSLRARAAC